MLRLCILASGSSGNCIFVGSGRARILIDAGLSVKETSCRLEAIGESLRAVHAICVTHEHDDHRASLGALQRRFGLPLYANAGTIEAIERTPRWASVSWNLFTTGSAFRVEDIDVDPFSVPHDSYDPVGFVVRSGQARVAVVTDMGMSTELIRERMRNCQAVVIESNHDERMLQDCARPWALKQRVKGRQGHLSNAQAGELAAQVAGPALRTVFLAHLSADCNRPELAVRTVREALDRAGYAGVEVELTYPDKVSRIAVIPDETAEPPALCAEGAGARSTP